MPKLTTVALIYDFDETLSVTYMQDYVLIPTLGMKPKTFWEKANAWSRDHCADQVTGSMYYFTMTARKKGIRLTRDFFCKAVCLWRRRNSGVAGAGGELFGQNTVSVQNQ